MSTQLQKVKELFNRCSLSQRCAWHNGQHRLKYFDMATKTLPPQQGPVMASTVKAMFVDACLGRQERLCMVFILTYCKLPVQPIFFVVAEAMAPSVATATFIGVRGGGCGGEVSAESCQSFVIYHTYTKQCLIFPIVVTQTRSPKFFSLWNTWKQGQRVVNL